MDSIESRLRLAKAGCVQFFILLISDAIGCWLACILAKGTQRVLRVLRAHTVRDLVQAIDLVDEAAAKLKMEITSKPEKLDEIDRQVRAKIAVAPLPPRAGMSP